MSIPTGPSGPSWSPPILECGRRSECVGAFVTRPVAAENTMGIEQAPDRSPASGAGQGAIESGARGDHLQPIYLDDLSYQPLTLIDTLTVTFADD